MTTSKHTMLPWRTNSYDFGGEDKWFIQFDSAMKDVTIAALNGNCMLYSNAESDAAFIVHCVNSHAALVDLLRRLDQLNDAAHGGIADYHDVWDDVKAALALVQKGT